MTDTKFVDDFAPEPTDASVAASSLGYEGTPPPLLVSVSEAAESRLDAILGADESRSRFLRVRLLAGGCSGYRYTLALDSEKTTSDLSFSDGRVVVDAISAAKMGPALIDFEETLSGSRFVAHIAETQSQCSCGSSFTPRA